LSRIRYRGFHDVPRIFIVSHQGQSYLFSSPFDDELDDYPDAYRVYLLPQLTDEQLDTDWEKLHSKSLRLLGDVPVREVEFDATRRREVNTAIIDNLLCASGKKQG
jgi:hypothetical protein